MSVRDTQRSKVYAAEERALRHESENLSVAECQALINKWASSKTIAARYPRARLPVEVRDGRGRRRACYCPRQRGGVIKVPRWARSKTVLAHEWAHHLTYAHDRAWHGQEFAEAYLYVVRVVIGKSAEERLRAEFKASRVRYRKPVKRPMTEAQREAARRRMIALNERRALTA